jgi:hypothetical protein
MKGTDPTPPQVTARYSKSDNENFHAILDQLRAAGLSVNSLLEWVGSYDAIGKVGGDQVQAVGFACQQVGAEVHWID